MAANINVKAFYDKPMFSCKYTGLFRSASDIERINCGELVYLGLLKQILFYLCQLAWLPDYKHLSQISNLLYTFENSISTIKTIILTLIHLPWGF